MIKLTIIKSAFVFIVSFLIIGICYIAPIIKLFPKLTGKYFVGSEKLYFIDGQRKELFSHNINDQRILTGHIFFPTENIIGLKRIQYLSDKIPFLKKSLAVFWRIPEWLTHLFFSNVSTNAYLSASLSESKSRYPVVLFSHGLLGLPSDAYLVILEELASHGYIVIGIDHSYFNLITVFPDGSFASSKKLTAEFEKLLPGEQNEFQAKAIGIYKTDIKFVLDQLATVNQDPASKFYRRLDLEKVCVMGHSAGGTASIELCRNDVRCKAAINLDGWYDHIIGAEPIQQPLLLLFGSKSIEVVEPTAEYLKKKQLTKELYFECEQKISEHRKRLCAVQNCSMIILPNVSHGDFGDGILLKWPLRALNDADSYQTILTINKHILEFLDKNLK